MRLFFLIVKDNDNIYLENRLKASEKFREEKLGLL
jgi:hypothetical protein